GRERIRPPAKTVRVDRWLDCRRHPYQAVGRRPRLLLEPPLVRYRSSQRLVEAEEVVCASSDGGGVVGVEQRPQRREIVLEIVDRARGLVRGRPRQACAAFAGRL